jgi:hypothetical protein
MTTIETLYKEIVAYEDAKQQLVSKYPQRGFNIQTTRRKDAQEDKQRYMKMHNELVGLHIKLNGAGYYVNGYGKHSKLKRFID